MAPPADPRPTDPRPGGPRPDSPAACLATGGPSPDGPHRDGTGDPLPALVRRVVAQLAGRPDRASGPRAASIHVAPARPRPDSCCTDAPVSPDAARRRAPQSGFADAGPCAPDRWITADDLDSATADSRLTPLADELAWDRGDGPSHSAAPHVIALACDHGGFKLKAPIAAELERLGWAVLDFGTHSTDAVDYPDFALAAAEAVATRRAQFAVVIDGAGIGSAMAANKVPGVRAANGSTTALARNAREHNYANVLTLGSGQLDANAALEILRTFLETPEGAPRHGARVAKITAIESRYGPTATPSAR